MEGSGADSRVSIIDRASIAVAKCPFVEADTKLQDVFVKEHLIHDLSSADSKHS